MMIELSISHYYFPFFLFIQFFSSVLKEHKAVSFHFRLYEFQASNVEPNLILEQKKEIELANHKISQH